MNNPLTQFISEQETSDICTGASACMSDCEFGSLTNVLRFEAPNETSCTGSRDRGCSSPYEIIIEIQPIEEETMLEREGHVSSTMYKFWYSPQYAGNSIAFNGAAFYLVGSDSKFISGAFDSKIYQHSDLIEYLGGKYMISSLSNWTGDGCDCPAINDGSIITLQEGIIKYWDDEIGERDATVDNDTFLESGILEPLGGS